MKTLKLTTKARNLETTSFPFRVFVTALFFDSSSYSYLLSFFLFCLLHTAYYIFLLSSVSCLLSPVFCILSFSSATDHGSLITVH